MNELLNPITSYELDRIAALDNPPPRLLLAMAGIVVLLWRQEGKDSIPQDVSYLAFQRICKEDSAGVANAMNTIVPASLSRVKIAALGSYMHLLNINDDFPGSALTGHELEYGNKLCKWVVLVVSAALTRLQMIQEEKRVAKMMKKSKDFNRDGGGQRSHSQLVRASTSPTTHRGGGSRGGRNNRSGLGTPQTLALSRSQQLAVNNNNNRYSPFSISTPIHIIISCPH